MRQADIWDPESKNDRNIFIYEHDIKKILEEKRHEQKMSVQKRKNLWIIFSLWKKPSALFLFLHENFFYDVFFQKCLCRFTIKVFLLRFREKKNNLYCFYFQCLIYVSVRMYSGRIVHHDILFHERAGVFSLAQKDVRYRNMA